jgi:heptosyltransferase-2
VIPAAGTAVVVRGPNWLGDTVMALPALRALRRSRADARITLTGRWAGLLTGLGVADALLPYPARAGARRRFNRALGAERPDVALVLPGSFESALAARQWRARRRIGYDTDARGALLTDRLPLPNPREHQIDEYARLVEALGIRVDDATPAWTLGASADADREIDGWLAEIGVGDRARLAGLHLGAAFGPSKLWPAESFARLAAQLASARLTPVLLGSPDDRQTEAAVVAASRRPPASLVGRDRVALMPRLLARLACLVSGDTGVAHLAAALGVPTVTLFGPTDPRLTAPRGPSARALANPAPCSPCFLASCPVEHSCMRGIEVDAVAHAVRRLALELPSARGGSSLA